MQTILRKGFLYCSKKNRFGSVSTFRQVWHAGYLNEDEARAIEVEIEEAQHQRNQLKIKMKKIETEIRDLEIKYEKLTGESFISNNNKSHAWRKP